MQDIFTQFLLQYHLPAIFVGAFLFGETVILTASFLAAQNWWTVFSVFWISLIGTVISDCLWFLLGQYITKTKRWEKYQEKYQKMVMILDKKIGNRPYLSLLIIKFLYGTRILTIIYLSFRKISLWKFFLFDSVGTAFWLCVIIPLGYFAGKGYHNIIAIFHNIGYALSALILFFILYRIVSVWISKKITEK